MLLLLARGCPAERTLTQQPQRGLLSTASRGSLKHLHYWRRGQPLTAGLGRNQAQFTVTSGLSLNNHAKFVRADKL